MEDIIQLITNNGIGIVCVAYLIYFQSTTMKSMESILNAIEQRLSVIEDKLERKEVN
jgi:hypothetical protein